MSIHSTRTQGQPHNIIILKIEHTDGQGFKIFFEEKRQGAETTVQQFIPATIPLSSLNSLSQEIYSILYKSTSDPENTTENIESLEKAGHHLYNLIFPIQIKENLASSDLRNLYLTIDQSLIGIPWELLFDGEEFFCLRFNMGRIIYTSHPTIKVKILNRQKMHMLILADPQKNLPKSYKEGHDLYRKLENWSDALEVSLLTTHIDTQNISRQIFECNILHYAGHAEYNIDDPGESGWHLEDGIFTAQKIKQLAGSKKAFPALVFSNACRSGQTSEWSKKQSDRQGIYQAFDLVDAFLLSGVQHYIGTFQEVRDLSSLSFALSFYGFMVQSYTIGESLRNARLELKGKYEKNRNNLIWAYYMLYGDPIFNYFGQEALQKPEEAEQVIKGDQEQKKKRIKTFIPEFQEENIRSGQGINQEEGSESIIPKRFSFHIGFPLKISDFSLKIAISLFIIFLILAGTVGILSQWNRYPNPPKPGPCKEDQADIDRLIMNIEDRLKERHKEILGDPHDTWTSRPISLAVFGSFSKEDMNPGEEKKIRRLNDMLVRQINAVIQNQSLVPLVDRNHLDEIFREYQYSLSDFADRRQDLIRFAKFLGARLIMFCEILPYQKDYHIDITVIETESSLTKIRFSYPLERETEYKAAANQIVQRVIKEIGECYPLQCIITPEENPDEVSLNIGSRVGLNPGFTFTVLGRHGEPRELGSIKVITVEQDSALARVLETKRPLSKGDRAFSQMNPFT